MPGMMETPLIYGQMSSQYLSVVEMVSARTELAPLGKMGTA